MQLASQLLVTIIQKSALIRKQYLFPSALKEVALPFDIHKIVHHLKEKCFSLWNLMGTVNYPMLYQGFKNSQFSVEDYGRSRVVCFMRDLGHMHNC